jgi:replication factor C subunit 1
VGSLGVDGNDSASPPKRAVSKRKKLSVLVLSDEEDEPHIVSPTNKKSGNAPASFSESKHIPKSSSAASPEKGLANATALDKKDMLASEMDEEDDDIYEEDLVPTKHRKPQPPIRKGPTKDITASAMPKPEDGAAAKSKFKYALSYILGSLSNEISFSWAAAKAAIAAGPRAPGSKQIPQPASENCLANLSFVFTGELSSFSREEAVDLAKRYGGYVRSRLKVYQCNIVLLGALWANPPPRHHTSFSAIMLGPVNSLQSRSISFRP